VYQLSCCTDAECAEKFFSASDEFNYTINGDIITLKNCSGETYNSSVSDVCIIFSNIIYEKYGKTILKGILKKEACLNETEKDKVFHMMISGALQKEKEIIKEELGDFLYGSNSISTSGFARFRLKKYKKYINEKIKSTHEKIKAEEEYGQFISLLQTYVDMQPPVLNIVHICVYDNGGYSIFDGKHKDITEECIRDVIPIFKEGDISIDDMLLSILIYVSPRIIYIHNSEFFRVKEIIDSIKNIFRKRVKICNGCSFCEKL